MKIRMKRNHQQIREADYHSASSKYHWLSQGPMDGETIFYSPDDWEEEPKERWEPVSVRCDGTVLRVDNQPPWEYHLSGNMRFREVTKFDSEVEGGSAFVIERRT